MINIVKYSNKRQDEWDSFLLESNAPKLLFKRDYMDYHKKKFHDFSLMVYNNKQQIIALLPGHIENTCYYSHFGLTYGSFILKQNIKLSESVVVLRAVIKYLKDKGFTELFIKSIPSFYYLQNTELLNWTISLLSPKIIGINLFFVLNLSDPIRIQKRRLRSIKKAIKAGIEIKIKTSLEEYWTEILCPHLKEKFNNSPVHSLEEIQQLAEKNSIYQCSAYLDGEIVAGATIYDFGHVVKAQYIASNDLGRKSGAIDLLFHELIHKFKGSKKFFDLGTANDSISEKLNFGLVDWKEGLGASVYQQIIYKIDNTNYKKLDDYDR